MSQWWIYGVPPSYLSRTSHGHHDAHGRYEIGTRQVRGRYTIAVPSQHGRRVPPWALPSRPVSLLDMDQPPAREDHRILQFQTGGRIQRAFRCSTRSDRPTILAASFSLKIRMTDEPLANTNAMGAIERSKSRGANNAPRRITRRGFLQRSAPALGALNLALAGVLGAPGQPGPNSRLVVAHIGISGALLSSKRAWFPM